MPHAFYKKTHAKKVFCKCKVPILDLLFATRSINGYIDHWRQIEGISQKLQMKSRQSLSALVKIQLFESFSLL